MTIDEARAEFPVFERFAYLNAGTNGPLARPTIDAMIAQEQFDLEVGRGGADYFSGALGLREALGEDRGSEQLAVGYSPVGHARIVQVRNRQMALVRDTADRMADAPLVRPGEADPRLELELPPLEPPEAPWVEDDRVASERP